LFAEIQICFNNIVLPLKCSIKSNQAAMSNRLSLFCLIWKCGCSIPLVRSISLRRKVLPVGIAVGNLCYMKLFDLVFLVVVCKSRNGIHMKLLKSDNICSFYTNLNIEKIGSCFGGKTIITDIWKIGHLPFHSSDRKKNMYLDPFLLFCLPFNIFPINNKMKLEGGNLKLPKFSWIFLFACF
jgi:hypothetical protein